MRSWPLFTMCVEIIIISFIIYICYKERRARRDEHRPAAVQREFEAPRVAPFSPPPQPHPGPDPVNERTPLIDK